MPKKLYEGVENFTQRNLPYGYTQIEYIQSSGTQYINTGVTATANTTAKYKYSIDQILTYGPHVLSGQSWYFPMVRGSTTGGTFVVNRGGNEVGSSAIAPKTGVIYEVDASFINNKVTVNGVEYGTYAMGNVSVDTAALHLMTYGGSPGDSQFTMNGKLYYCQIYENGTLLRDFIPAKNSAGTIGLYDLANGVFYTNSGTGTFTAGSTYESVARKGKKMYFGVENLARKVKKSYIGITADLPIYTETTVTITGSNIGNYFSVSNPKTFCFRDNNGTGTFSSTITSSSSKPPSPSDKDVQTILTALHDINLSITFGIANHSTSLGDYQVYLNDTQIVNRVSPWTYTNVNGSPASLTLELDLIQGDTLTFNAKLSNIQPKVGDFTFSNLISTIKKQTGTETKSVARIFFDGVDLATMPITYTGNFTDQRDVVMGDKTYRLLTLTSSGTLTLGDSVTADVWLCSGGNGGMGSGFAGGAGGLFVQKNNISISEPVVCVVGSGHNGGESSNSGSSFGGSSKFGEIISGIDMNLSSNGASGGGAGGKHGANCYAGKGCGVTTVPFGETSLFEPHCAGGGGGNFTELYEVDDDTRIHGGNGGSDGSDGYNSNNTGSSIGGLKGGGNGGTSGESGNDATFYGSGGGAGAYYYKESTDKERWGRGGAGYQGIIYVRIPYEQ